MSADERPLHQLRWLTEEAEETLGAVLKLAAEHVSKRHTREVLNLHAALAVVEDGAEQPLGKYASECPICAMFDLVVQDCDLAAGELEDEYREKLAAVGDGGSRG